MSKTTKKWLVSSLVTFATAFCIAIVPMLNDLTLETLRNGALIGVLFTGVRAGVKALAEWFIARQTGSKK